MGQGLCCARLRVAWCLQGFLMCVLLWECALKMVNFEFCVLDTWFTLRSCQSRNYFILSPWSLLGSASSGQISEAGFLRARHKQRRPLRAVGAPDPLGRPFVYSPGIYCALGMRRLHDIVRGLTGGLCLGKCFPCKHESLTSIPHNRMKKLGTVVGTQHPSIRAMEVAGPSDTTGQPV